MTVFTQLFDVSLDSGGQPNQVSWPKLFLLLLQCMVRIQQLENSRPVVVMNMPAVLSAEKKQKCPGPELCAD